MEDKTFKLSFDAIGQLIKLVQLAMITRTDVADHLRVMEFCDENGELFLTQEYGEKHEAYINRLLEKANELAKEQQEIEDARSAE